MNPRSDELNHALEPSSSAAMMARAEDAYPAPTDREDAEDLLRVWAGIRRYWAAIVLFVVLATTLTAIVVWRMPPWYQSTAVVRVDPSAPMNVVGDSASNARPTSTDILVQTEAGEARSAAVATLTILKLHLQSLPELQDNSPDHSGSVSDSPVSPILVRNFLRRETVDPEEFTLLIDISYRARSPQLAAAVANELARQLLDHEYISRATALGASSHYMSSQLDDLRAQMERSQQRLNAYAQAHNIVDPSDRFGVMNERLGMLAKDLEQQRARQRQVEADWTLARIGSVDALAVSDRGEALKPLLEAAQKQQVKMAAIAAKYGPGHFLYRQAERQAAQLDATVARERAHLRAQIQAEDLAARSRVALAQRDFAAQKRAIEAFNGQALAFSALKNEADTDQRLYGDLLQRLRAEQIAAGYHADNLRIVGLARPEPLPVAPPRLLAVLLAFLLSSSLGVAVALVATRLSRSLADAADVQRWLRYEVLASLPSVRQTQELHSLIPQPLARGSVPAISAEVAPARAAGRERSGFAEAILSLRTALFFAAPRPARSWAISSAQPQEGKSTVAANLACAFALHSASVLLIDADLRRPEIHRLFGLSNQIGLSTLLHQPGRWQEAVHTTAIASLQVLPAGPAVAGEPELLALRFAPLLEELKCRFDFVIVDCPPLLGFSDALSVAACVDAALLVVRAGRTPREFARNALDQLRHVRASVAGIALNGVSARTSAYYDYYLRRERRYPPAAIPPAVDAVTLKDA